MSRIDDAEIGLLRLAARSLLVNERFWVLALAETVRGHLSMSRIGVRREGRSGLTGFLDRAE